MQINVDFNSGRVLGIDYGEKRIGLAISDESQTIARELMIVSPKKFWQEINQLINTQQISKIVLGWPLNMSGQMTDKTREVESFQSQLVAETGLPVAIADERLSSQMAGQILGSKKDLDSLSAQILLQNYLNSQKRIVSSV
jgi:putative Holliday junction resolvase